MKLAQFVGLAQFVELAQFAGLVQFVSPTYVICLFRKVVQM